MAYWVTGSLAPFDDTLKPPVVASLNTSDLPYDTTAIDHLRQGVELTRQKYLQMGAQPKFLASEPDRFGRITHQTNELFTLGQAVSFTDFDGNATWSELPRFDPVDFIRNNTVYPLPIVFNDGPQQTQEAIMEPFTIPFRLPSNEGRLFAHKVWGEYSEGNTLDNFYTRACSLIENFVDINLVPKSVRPFLDSGEERFGDSITGSIYRSGYISSIERKLFPFTDQENQDIFIPMISASANMTGSLRQLLFSSDDNLQPTGKKPSTSGFTYYNGTSQKYGTDSVAFGRLEKR